MLTDTISEPESVSADEVFAEYEAALLAVIETRGVDAVAADTTLSADRVADIESGDGDPVTVAEAAELLALTDDWPDAETVRLELQDHVMLQMSSAVVDVDSLADGIDAALDPKEVQQKVEGRQPMTLREYAEIHHYLAVENPW
ncbi:DUF5791 family protein [Salarchaeum sp. III]|uniref:DUF5791 family protein n=1 Tax=Salarchaeum sp. III TaxID=3107927 RepID=UPI002ED93E82